MGLKDFDEFGAYVDERPWLGFFIILFMLAVTLATATLVRYLEGQPIFT